MGPEPAADLVTYAYGSEECCACAVIKYRKGMHAGKKRCRWEMTFAKRARDYSELPLGVYRGGGRGILTVVTQLFHVKLSTSLIQYWHFFTDTAISYRYTAVPPNSRNTSLQMGPKVASILRHGHLRPRASFSCSSSCMLFLSPTLESCFHENGLSASTSESVPISEEAAVSMTSFAMFAVRNASYLAPERDGCGVR
jgi:hypothetical protein